MSVTSEYGFNKQEYDHSLFYNKRHFTVRWEGTGTVDNSPDVDLYLLIDGKYRGLYVPENTFCMVKWKAMVLNGSTLTAQEELGTLTRTSGGNVTYTGGAIGTIDPTVTPTANTTLQALLVVVSDADSEQAVTVMAEAEVWVIYSGTNNPGQSRFPTAPTAAPTSVE